MQLNYPAIQKIINMHLMSILSIVMIYKDIIFKEN